ncbi:MAG: ferric reductase-like transmembrane domain-containing protein [Proteobacteria bacterium]|nr:ferric reductase-like transmembrane domain-containing protein [Pseudomonadota bacterium]
MKSRHALSGTLWLALYVFLSLLPILIVSVGPKPPGREFLTEFSVAVGFMALAMMCLQFALTARFRWLKEPFGSDVVYSFHRAISLVAAAFVVCHPTLLSFTPVRSEVFVRLDLLNHPFFPRWGFGAALLLGTLVVTSLGRKRFHISYEFWRRLHAVCAIGVVLFGVLHVVVENHYFGMPLKGGLWIAYTCLWICLTLWVRLGKPSLLLSRPFVVESVRAERGNAWTIALAPDGHSGFRFSPGQFGWLTLFSSPFADREHPFSFSCSAEAAPRLEFTVKELGDFTREVHRAAPGDRAYVDGPFGAITADRHRHASGFVLIAGGVGITPMMSHLRTFADRGDPRPLLLIYANNVWDEVTFREEIERLQLALNLRVAHVLAKPPQGWQGESGFVTEELLRRWIPPLEARHEYFVCGPPGMMLAVEQALVNLGVSRSDIHSERFDLV